MQNLMLQQFLSVGLLVIGGVLVLACCLVAQANLAGRTRAWTLMTGFGVITALRLSVFADRMLFGSGVSVEWRMWLHVGREALTVIGWALILIGLVRVFGEFQRERDRCDELAAELAALSAGKGEPQWNVERATS